MWKWKFICSWIASLQVMTKLSALDHIFQKWLQQQLPPHMLFSNTTFLLPIRRGDVFLHTLEPGRAPRWLSSIGYCGNNAGTDLSEALRWPGGLCFLPLETLAPGMLLWKPSHHAARSPSHRERLTVVSSPR